MRIALYQPDIPQNTGTIIRTAACLGVTVDVIEPCGFPFSAQGLKRAGMDYLGAAKIVHHDSWQAFEDWRMGREARLILLTTKAETAYTAFAFETGDILLLGRESAGVPAAVAATADARIRIPMRSGMRSLNVAVAAAMVLGEALRQTGHKVNSK